MKTKVLLISVLVLLVLIVVSFPDNQTWLIFCDVGQGDGALIQRGNFQMIIDAGPDNQKMAGCLSRYMPFWDKTIEAAVISHWDADHSGGLEKLSRSYRIERLIAASKADKPYEQINYTDKIASGDIIRAGEIYFEIFSPEEYCDDTEQDKNDNSVVGVLGYKANKILFLGDATAEVEERLVWRDVQGRLLNIDILKVSHHGAGTATSEALVGAMAAKTAVISVGKNNMFGHPNPEVVKRLEKAGMEILRTDRLRDIIFKLL